MRKSLLLVVACLVAVGIIFYWLEKTRPPGEISFAFPQKLSNEQTLTVPLTISVTTPMNAAEFYFSFPTDLLSVKEIQTTGSIYQLWIKDSPSFNNDTGQIYIAGGLPKPGFVGRNGLIAKVVFTTKKSGTGKITLDETKTRILANDGQGSKITTSAWQPVNFEIR
ncbi:MAG TPA: cohesin domain-containing protein [Candidatus Saccharimonadales bacterium]|nr:cohesin domain-containing protein [Candidatus Saccharimonadales bacterium]